ncbi:MAG: rubrerythrin family protein [Deferrisomatales bacterium]
MAEPEKYDLYGAFVAEAKAYFRLLEYARRADQEGFPQIGLLFRVIAESERIHASRNLRLLGDLVVKDTQQNLEESFEREQLAAQTHYPELMRQASEEGNRIAELVYSQNRDVEARHAELYRHALQFLAGEQEPEYSVCRICGYVAEGAPPEVCPVCGAKEGPFRRVE